MDLFSDEYFMKEALKEAQKALDKDEVPIGAVIVSNNQVIARAHNLTETLNDVTAHAEMQAITAAANYLGGKYLTDCTLYVTLEPCVMCIGASDPKKGFSHYDSMMIHPKTNVLSGVLEDKCSTLIKDFFKTKR